MNGKVAANTGFKRVFVQPNAGDGGLSLGSAFYFYHHMLSMPRKKHLISSSFGTDYTNGDVEAALAESGLKYARHDDIAPRVAAHIADGRVIGWFQGKMEFGPRALGNRSILADPRRAEMRDYINSVVKHREHFRPFAPSVLEEDAIFSTWAASRPFILLAVNVRSDKAAGCQPSPTWTGPPGAGGSKGLEPDRRLIEFKVNRDTDGAERLLTLKGEPVVSSRTLSRASSPRNRRAGHRGLYC